ncbi:hypothetical protein E6H14_05020 [Candidatus Bathyarchaeota archaeon]|nr:MAG: hypothetical protein E6H14_05020 [Candidatus Bathyarchaeota archaeon]
MSDVKEDLWLDLDLAAANVNRAGTVLGSTIAVFTFLLFFLYPRYSSGQIDPVLFQITLTIIVLTILSFSLCILFCYRIGVLKMSSAEKHASMQIGALLWVIGILFAVLEPAFDIIHNWTQACRRRCAERMAIVHLPHLARCKKVPGLFQTTREQKLIPY